MSKQYFLKGTLILTCAGLVTRFIGFFYRIFLSHTIGAQDLGIYQLVSPLQMLVLSITTFGIQTAISRLAASRLAVGKSRDAGDIFFLGAGISVLLSSLLAWVLYHNSAFFSAEILKETQTEPFIRLLSFGLPLSSLHICANGYYFARKKAEIPSGIQFLEQLVRVGVTYLLYQIFLSEGREITAFIAVGGSLASEGAAAFVSLLAIGGSFHKHNYTPLPLSQPAKKIGDILQLSFPLSVNRVLLTLLSSIEVVLIPQRLRMYGLGSEEALSIYGILTGMVMPLLLFPSTITNSASVMLMPSIAELQALGYSRRIRYVISQAGKYCFSLGGACTFVFRQISGRIPISQSHSRNLHTDHGLYLPVYVSEYSPIKYSEWAWKNRRESCTQCCKHGNTYCLCAFRHTPSRHTGLSVWSPVGRDSSKRNAYFFAQACQFSYRQFQRNSL